VTLPTVSALSGINPGFNSISTIVKNTNFSFFVDIPNDTQTASQITWSSTANTFTTVIGGTKQGFNTASPQTAILYAKPNASTMTITIASFSYPNNSAGSSTYPGGNITVINIP
jgi:glucosamine 6-phosphate synthetase-like amidotransferase/phosphosugar isomerase protein